MLLNNGKQIELAPQGLAELVPQMAQGYYYPDAIGMELERDFAIFSELFRGQPWVYTAVCKRANAIARLPIAVWNVGGKTRQLDTSSGYASLMADPCPYLDPFRFWFWTQATKDIYGEAFHAIVRDQSTGKPIALLPMHPTRVAIKRDPWTGDYTYTFQAGAGYGDGLVQFPQEDVVPFLDYNPLRLERGMSRLMPLRSTLANEDSSRNAMSASWKHAGRPNIVLSTDKRLGDDGRKRLKESFDATHSGSSQAGQTLVLEDGLTAKALQLTAQELQWIESRKLNREEVCFAPGVRVMTSEGMVPIESLQVGDMVLTHRGRFRPVTALMQRSYDGPMVRVQAASLNEVLVTPNHPFFVQQVKQRRDQSFERDGDPDWLPAGQLAARRRRPSGVFAWGAHQALTIPRLQAEGSDVVDLARWVRPTAVVSPETVKGGSNGRAIEIPRFIKANYDLGWLIGLYVTDGTVGDHQATWYLGPAERHLAEEVRRVVAETFGIDTAIRPFESTIRAVVSSRPIVDFLDQFGHGPTRKHLTKWCMEQGDEFREGLIQGMLDGDGHCDPEAYSRVTTTSTALMWQLRLLLWTTGRGGGVTRRDPGQWSIQGRTGERVESWSVSWKTSRSDRYRVQGGDYQHFYVKSAAEEDYAGIVYNISVQDDESYVTEGGAVHNCAVFDIAPTMVHILDHATFSNISAQMRAFYRDTMAPPIEGLESALDTYVGKYWQGSKAARFSLDDVLRGDFEIRADAAARLATVGGLTPDEVRELMGYSAFDGEHPERARRLYANAAMQPLGEPAERITLTGPVGHDPDGVALEMTAQGVPATTVPSSDASSDGIDVPQITGPASASSNLPEAAVSTLEYRPKHLRAIKGAMGRGIDVKQFALQLAQKCPDDLEDILRAVAIAIQHRDNAA